MRPQASFNVDPDDGDVELSLPDLEEESDAPDPADMEDEDREIAQQMIDRIQAVDQVGESSGRYDDVVGVEVEDVMGSAGGKVPGYQLPGFADETMQHDCGESQLHMCDECGSVHDRGRTCKQSRCPRCWKKWAMERAETHVGRADAVARYRGSSGTAHHKHHVAFMLPEDWRPRGDPDERYRETQKVVRDIISEIWGDDAMYVYHGWSGSGYGDDGGGAEHDDMGEWAPRLPDGVDHRDWAGDVRDELYQRPHFHAIIVSSHIPGGDITSRVYDETGWLIRRFADDEGRSISGEDRQEEMEDLARATAYTLSHTAVKVGHGDENNDARVHTCGSRWRNYRKVTTYSDTEVEAKRAVRAVAPTVLDLSEDEISCAEEIAPERAAGDEADVHHSEDHGDDVDDVGEPGTSILGRVVGVDEAAGEVRIQSGTQQRTVRVDDHNVADWEVGDKVEATGEIDEDGVLDGELDDPRVGCQGTMRHIRHADEYVEDEDWMDRAQWSEQARQAYLWWTGADGAPPTPPPT